MVTRITTPKKFHEELLSGYWVEVIKIPPRLAANDWTRQDYDDRSIEVAKSAGAVWFHVSANEGHQTVATAVFAADDEVVRCDTIEVMPNFRLQGIATDLYKLASRIFATPVVPSDNLTDDARAFWGSKKHFTYRPE